MKKVLFNNGVDVELAYLTNEVKFGKQKYSASKRTLSISRLKKGKFGSNVVTHDFDLDDYETIYGSIENNVQQLSIFEFLGDWLADLRPDEMVKIVGAIRSFKIGLTADLTNEEFAEKLFEQYRLNQ